MKKHGFTLAEVLIALSIIAVGAAILAPTYLQLKPDRYKFKVLNCYKLINEATEAMLSNPEIYYRKPIDISTPSYTFLNNGMLNPSSGQYGCSGLMCTEQPKISPFNNSRYQGQCKYMNLLADMLNLKNIKYCGEAGTMEVNGTRQGQTWHMQLYCIAYWSGSIKNCIIVDFDPSENSPNCAYKNTGNNKCLHPDRFIFAPTINGDIYGVDPLTKVYLGNMANTDKSADFDAAAAQP